MVGTLLISVDSPSAKMVPLARRAHRRQEPQDHPADEEEKEEEQAAPNHHANLPRTQPLCQHLYRHECELFEAAPSWFRKGKASISCGIHGGP